MTSFLGVFGFIVFLLGLLDGLFALAEAQNVMQQIYAALMLILGLIGLVISGIGTVGAEIVSSIKREAAATNPARPVDNPGAAPRNESSYTPISKWVGGTVLAIIISVILVGALLSKFTPH